MQTVNLVEFSTYKTDTSVCIEKFHFFSTFHLCRGSHASENENKILVTKKRKKILQNHPIKSFSIIFVAKNA